jgi:hypothetical protein
MVLRNYLAMRLFNLGRGLVVDRQKEGGGDMRRKEGGRGRTVGRVDGEESSRLEGGEEAYIYVEGR